MATWRVAAWPGPARGVLIAFHPVRSKPARTTKGSIMADSSPLAGLLDRAGNVFTLAGKLGWKFLPATFAELVGALGELREETESPPKRFDGIARLLRDVGRNAKEVRERLDKGTDPAFLESCAVQRCGTGQAKKLKNAPEPMIRSRSSVSLAHGAILRWTIVPLPAAPLGTNCAKIAPATVGGQVGNGFYRGKWIALSAALGDLDWPHQLTPTGGQGP